jgi:glycosyltransferase involved in cell wall biosynthesis
MPTLTVFTPTFNRAQTLPRVYESLCRQSSRDFLWLVIDDGSHDDTRALVERWRASADFAVEYLYQANSGKHNAHNVAVARAKTELFTIVDSDDELLPDAVERLVSAWQRATSADKAKIAGIWSLCTDPRGEIVGGPFPEGLVDATLQELRYREKMNKEMLPTFVTEVLRQHPFPHTPPGECPFIPEAYVWMQVTRYRPLRFLNEPCRVYHQGEGLISLARDEYPLSRCIVYGYLGPVATDLEWFWSHPSLFLMNAVQAGRYAIFGRQFWKLVRPLPRKAKVLMIAAAPVALVLLARDKLSGRIERQLRAGGGIRKATPE